MADPHKPPTPPVKENPPQKHQPSPDIKDTTSPHAMPPKASTPDLPSKPPDNYPEPKDFHLAEPGSKDYVAGQPVDDAELSKTEADAKAKAEPGKETHSPHYDDKK